MLTPIRRWIRGTLPVLFALGVLLAASPARVFAQQAPQQGVTVDSVRVEGNKLTDTALIRSTFGLKPGDSVTAEGVRTGLQRLWALKLFSDLSVDGERGGRGLVLVVKVVERPRISAVRFEGANKLSSDDLLGKISSKVGTLLDRGTIESDRRKLLAAYEEESYARAEVTPLPKVTDGKAELVFRIDEGQKSRIREIRFEGNSAFGDKRLRKTMKTKPKGFLRGGGYKREKFDEDIDRVTAFYKNHGYKDAKITDHALRYSPDGKDLRIDITVEEGPKFTLGKTRFEGNSVLSDSLLTQAVRYKPGDEYNQEEIDRASSEMYNMYMDRGYLVTLSIRPDTEEHDHTVDVLYRIHEGEPSHIGEVKIVGNTRTKERVIRRELTVFPGQLFRRSLLQRSQRDVFALGFFEDVTVDYQPPANGDSTDIDLQFRVKEKQTGTASAGLGYSSDTGLTGFVELGHNNLFGNGQSVSIKLERGSRTNNYEVSFNEPWFMNTPTSLGVDLFNTDRSLDLYDEKRQGGSVSVGRPIPWLDYTRGFATYSLENVKLSNFSTPAIATLFANGSGTGRTSSMQLGLIRNSTDNPFYPTAGSRITTSSEFAGGVLGGDVDYQKHVIDQRYYFRPFWKPALMLRMRTGVLTGYHSGASVPSYETFRLGGTTADYLRGYDDYYVVPRENVKTSGGAIVRYPGGRYALTLTAEYQFLIAEPVHGLFFFDAGDTWNSLHDVDLTSLRRGAGVGIRLEVPMIGAIGFDYAYGFDRDNGKGGWRPHLILGRLF